MRAIIIFGLLLMLNSCKKECISICYNNPQPFRIAVLNSQNDNLLEPGSPEELIIDGLVLSTGQDLSFTIKDYVVESEPIGFFYLESIDNAFFANCVDKECEIYQSYQNSLITDTINVLIEKVVREDEEGCKCTEHPTRYYKHNGEIITEFDWEPNNTGAAIMRR